MFKEMKTKSVTIRVTDSEINEIDKKAKIKGLTRTQYLLNLVKRDKEQEEREENQKG